MMEPFSTVILLASLAGMPATMNRNWSLDKKERAPIYSPTNHLVIDPGKASTELTITVKRRVRWLWISSGWLGRRR